MTNRPLPPDQPQREQALDPTRSILVQAPAGSGKTDLLTRRFLRLLAEVEDPGQIVAITFTNAAAAEMRHRILAELEKAAQQQSRPTEAEHDEFAMETLAARALARSQALGWKLIDLPAQLRVTTIDAFCREIAQQLPLLTGLGGSLEIAPLPEELYRRAARSTLRQIDGSSHTLIEAIEALLLWRDNNWQELETQLIEMLSSRDRWMQDFVLDREPDWEELRARLERPFAEAMHTALVSVPELLEQLPIAEEEILSLARFSCATVDLYRDLAELAQLPMPPFTDTEEVEDARRTWRMVADFLLIKEGRFRRTIDVKNGFPPKQKLEKERFLRLTEGLRSIDGLEEALDGIRSLPSARYHEADWRIVRACFTLLRHAAGELQLAFAESGVVDFTEVAQIALRVLRDADQQLTDAALAVAEKIRHLLVDEFQDTSRRQHQLLASLISAWPEREGRTAFFVGDPMQSIYFFRDADAELFARVKNVGLELPLIDGLDNEPLLFDFMPLQSNFRTEASLVEANNQLFEQVFAQHDGSGIEYSAALPMRSAAETTTPHCQLHLEFIPKTAPGRAADPALIEEKEAAHDRQLDAMLALIQSLTPQLESAQRESKKFRIAILARAKSALVPIAARLRDAQIAFRAVELEKLQDRPEVLDALALARALASPLDRVAWLGLLRAPWCGLSLASLHRLIGGDDKALLARPVRELLEDRIALLEGEERAAVARVLSVLQSLPALRAALPTITLGSRMEQVWLRLGGAACVNAAQRANLDLLWNSLDTLPNGEEDLSGPALDAALRDLTALPNPTASAECGVQLMTIHKSKGLEFEVVLVPDLQAKGAQGDRRMLSWLERGLAEPDESGAITEFLIAPLQSKGEDRGSAKAFVDRSIRERERQEMRRLLYVAATRAREELHYFARPSYKSNAAGELSLATPEGLLATVWPALGTEIEARFNTWITNRPAQEVTLETLAASREDNLIAMPAPGTLLHRLPIDFALPEALDAPLQPSTTANPKDSSALYQRHEGGLVSRALGTAVHTFLEEFSRLHASMNADAARAELNRLLPNIAAQIRSRGLNLAEARRIAQQAYALAEKATTHPLGLWILSPHRDAQSEAGWTGFLKGSLRNLQADRVFRAGAEPLIAGEECWWIVDYKTTHSDAPDPQQALPQLRELYRPQLEAYAELLRALHGSAISIRAGLFYPRMECFDWWAIEQ